MSVSHNLITATATVEEIQKWRCTKMNNGELEHDDQHERDSDSLSMSSGFVSPQQTPTTTTSDEGWSLYNCLSENNNPEQKTPQKNVSNKLSAQQHPPRIYRTYFVRLAEESPKRNNCDEFSDSSTYDSFNCRETDICRDSSDTESNSSFSSGEIGATIKVVEYEVDSASNSEDLFTNDSSSGTDDFILAAVARAICNTSKCSSDFADTEEDSCDSNSTYDSEFSLADYWVCVKCKNKQNNPMFRYCEKCYQIRKTHFPPRPRLRKSRTMVKEQRNSQNHTSLRRSATTSELLESLTKKRKQDDNAPAPPNSTTSSSSTNSCSLQNVSSKITTGRLAAKRSHDQIADENSSSDDDNNARHLSKRIVQMSANRNVSKETPYSTSCLNKLNEKTPAQQLRTAAKRKLSKAPSKYKTLAKRQCIQQNPMHSLSSGTENETDIVLSQPMCIVSSQGTQKDSGFSSAPSSQERKSSSDHANEDEEDCISNCGNNGENSSDTVCDELSESDVADMSMSQENNCIPSTLEFDLNSQDNSLGRHASDISSQTTVTESHAIGNLVQSVSECSDAYTNLQTTSSNPELPELSAINEKIRSQNSVLCGGGPKENGSCDYPSYGSCMTCLTEPKNGVFVHSRFLHLCCCYKCAVKIWNKNKKCPICNCAVKNVMKLFVH